MPHLKQKQGKLGTVVDLNDYRERRIRRDPSIEITIRGGLAEYDTHGIDGRNAFEALLGCYVVAGKLLQDIRENMRRCGANGCGTTE